jgi:hypothetical protein
MKAAILVLMISMAAFGLTLNDWGYCDSPAAGAVGGNNNWYGVRFTPPADCNTGTISQIQMWTATSTASFTNPTVHLRVFKFVSSQTNPITEPWSPTWNFPITSPGTTGAWVTYNLNTPFTYDRSVAAEMLIAFQSEHAPSHDTWVSEIGYDGSIGTPNRNYVVVNKNMPTPADWSLSAQGDYMIRLTFTYTPQLTPVLPTSLGNIKAVYN